MKVATFTRCYTAGILAAHNKKCKKTTCNYETENRIKAWVQGYEDYESGLIYVNNDGSWSTQYD